MVEAEDLMQLRLRNRELLRRLQAGQAAMRHLVARASESSVDPSRNYDLEASSSPETSSDSSSTSSCSRDKCYMYGVPDAHQGDLCDKDWLSRVSSRVASLPPATCQHLDTLGSPRPHSAPLLATTEVQEPASSTRQCDLGPEGAQALKSILARHSRPPRPRVTFCDESTEAAVPQSNWRLRPYLGYDWIAGSLDSSSPISSRPEAFFATLQEFREANKEACSHLDSRQAGVAGSQLLGLQEGPALEDDHECVYCYRVNRRLFLVPSDPGTPCHLCGMPRDQRGPATLEEPAQVRVNLPLSTLDPPHHYRVHRRKSFDASDTLALPRHCLLGWDVFPPQPEKSSAPKSLDLWSSLSPEVQQQKLSATSPSRLALLERAPCPSLMWADPRAPQPCALRQKP
ncbi:migration and invasion-inhibitory protein [Ctenodactylus gundi]